MGLSDEERRTKLYYATNAMAKLGKGTLLEPLTNQLWHAFIGDRSNGLHWFMGSESSNKLHWGHDSPWGCGVLHHTDRILEPESPFDKEHEWDFRDNFEIKELLRKKASWNEEINEEAEKVFEIYRWTEQATYALRRYDDELLKELKGYSKLLSDIQGACFNEFMSHEFYAKAYTVHQIMDVILEGYNPYQKDKCDVLTTWIREKCVFHDMDRCMEMPLEELAKIHISLVKDKSEKNKALNLAKLMVRRLHKYKDDPYIKKFVPRKMFEEAKRMYEDHDKPEKNPEQGELTVYGLSHMERD
jgi:hypothetical protein